MIHRFLVGVAALALVACAPRVATHRDSPTDDATRYAALVEQLAAPQMEGRGVGTRGIDLARDLIENRLATLGLDPAFVRADGSRSFTQPFEVSLGIEATTATLEVGGEAKHRGDFSYLGFSGEGAFSGPAVFVGYGIAAPEHDYDSFAGIAPEDLRGKVFVAFRYEPMDGDGRSLWARGRQWTDAASLPSKAKWAAERGAAALIVIDPPKQEGNTLRSTTGTAFDDAATIPVLHARPSVLRDLLRRAGRDAGSALREYQRRADEGKLAPDALGVAVAGEVRLERRRATACNVAAVLPGRGDLAGETVVVGAHYDHIGHGEIGSLAEDPEGRLHPGADDNASGVAAMLLLAERMATRRDAADPASRRAVLFAAFSAEERGLLGANHLVNHPDQLAVPLDGVVAMVNFDMVGRMSGDKTFVFGVQSGDGWEALLSGANAQTGLELATTGGGGVGMSDHAAFHAQRIPAVHFFTGVHEDYHRPTDTAEKINARGGIRVIDLATNLVAALTTRPERLAFREVSPHGPHPALPRDDGPYLGIMPDYTTLDGDGGVGVTSVMPGSPAEKAGLQSRDIITRWNDEPLPNIRALTARLAGAKIGDRITLTIRRGEQTLTLEAELGQR